jgi:hypothetical protein
MFFPTGDGERFRSFEKRVHKYSGLSPDDWSQFLTNMAKFRSLVDTDKLDEATLALYASIENVRNIGLRINRPDDVNFAEELEQIASELGYEGEFIINQNALSRGLYFFPKYLNESVADFTENARPIPRLRSDS